MKITEAFTLPANKSDVYKENGMNKDIRDYLEILFPEAVKECTWKIDAIFKGSTPLGTACLIWTFLRTQCKYRKDPDHTQIIRKPAYFVNHVPHLGDCKTFALFARAVYASIYPDLETSFCFAAYAPGATQPTHVYVKVKDENGRIIIIDGCWGFFNSEKEYSFVLPYKWRSMKITSLGYAPKDFKGVKSASKKLLARKVRDGHMWFALCPICGMQHGSGSERSVLPDYVFCNHGIGAVPPSTNQYNASALLNSINDNASAEYRNRINDLATARRELERARIEYDGGHLSRTGFESVLGDCIRIMNDKQVSGHAVINKRHKTKEEKKEARKRRRRKAGEFFKKFGHYAQMVQLAPFRGCFVAFIAMNINGLASNLRLVKQLPNQTGWKKIQKIWYALGGSLKALDKAIKVGTKHKALWIGKRAHRKFEQRAKDEGYNVTDKGKGAKWLQGIDGIYYKSSYEACEGIYGPQVAAVVAGASSIVAAILPVVIKTLDQNGHKHEAETAAAGGQDLIDGGQPSAAQLEQLAVPPGESAGPDVDPNTMVDDNPDDTHGNDDDDDNTIADHIEMFINDALDEVANLIPQPAAKPGEFDWSSITKPLTQFADAGLHLGAAAIERKVSRSPKLQATFGKGNLDTLFAGTHLRANGDPYADMYKHRPKRHHSGFGMKELMIGGGILAAVLLAKKK